MGNFFRKVGFALFVLILTAAIYVVFYAEKEVQQDVLDFSLNLMGDKLMAMVPEVPEKSSLDSLYHDFKQRALRGDATPEQVETVAANILNASNTETTLTPVQAEGLLRSGMLVNASVRIPEDIQPLETIQPETRPVPENWKLLGERVKIMFEFNDHLAEAIDVSNNQNRNIAKQMQYQTKNGLCLVFDGKLKDCMDEEEFRQVSIELAKLEQENLFNWQENFEEELEKQMEGVMEELETLEETFKELESVQFIEALAGLEALKSLENLEHIPIINADSIQKIVEQSLREAGLPFEDQEID